MNEVGSISAALSVPRASGEERGLVSRTAAGNRAYERSGMWLESVRVGFAVYGKILLLLGRMVGKPM